MRKNKRGTDIIGLIMVLLIFPLIIYWKEVLIIATILIIAIIIYKIIKILTIIKRNYTIGRNADYKEEVEIKINRRFGFDIVQLDDETEEYFKNYKPELTYSTLATHNNVGSDFENKKEIKGTEAEYNIGKILNRIFLKENIILNSYFVDKELVTTEVDIIVVDTTGIYVIESKDYSGIIKGKTDENSWFQLFRGKKYNKFFNPIMQNARHIEALKNNLRGFEISDEALKSYIIFSNKSNLQIEFDSKCTANVIKQKELFYAILEDRKMTPNLLTDKQVEDISRRFRAHANVDDKFKNEHILRRKNKVKYTK